LLVSTEATSQLLIAHCDNCARWVHPAAAECRDCGEPLVARPVSGQGTVFTYTINYHAFNPLQPRASDALRDRDRRTRRAERTTSGSEYR